MIRIALALLLTFFVEVSAGKSLLGHDENRNGYQDSFEEKVEMQINNDELKFIALYASKQWDFLLFHGQSDEFMLDRQVAISFIANLVNTERCIDKVWREQPEEPHPFGLYFTTIDLALAKTKSENKFARLIGENNDEIQQMISRISCEMIPFNFR